MNLSDKQWSKVLKTKDRIVSRKIAGETILVPIRGNLADLQRIFVLNSVAEYIWLQLDEEKSFDEIRDSILLKFDVEKEEAERDLREFITGLLEAGLVEKVY